jgi:hypothetical protein
MQGEIRTFRSPRPRSGTIFELLSILLKFITHIQKNSAVMVRSTRGLCLPGIEDWKNSRFHLIAVNLLLVSLGLKECYC